MGECIISDGGVIALVLLLWTGRRRAGTLSGFRLQAEWECS